MSLSEVVIWFRQLKEQGVTKEEVLDVLDFDSEQEVNHDVLEQAKRVVFGK